MVKEREFIIPVEGAEVVSNKESSETIDTSETQVLDEKSNELEILKDQLQRLQAEFINYKTRVSKEREKDFSNAKALLITKILPVLDDFERMIDHHQIEGSCDVEGVILIFENLQKVLMDENLEVINAVGQPFNPQLHEAVDVHETGEDKDGIVMEEWQKGYRFDEKLLRPSRVKVGKYTNTEKK